MAWRDDTGMIAARDFKRRSVQHMKRLAHGGPLQLQQLQAESRFRPEAEIVNLVVARFLWQAVAVVLVRRVARPATGANGKEFGD